MPRDPRERPLDDRIRAQHMVESAQRAVRIASGFTAASLAADEIRMLAVVKSIEIVGEAGRPLPLKLSPQPPALGCWPLRSAGLSSAAC